MGGVLQKKDYEFAPYIEVVPMTDLLPPKTQNLDRLRRQIAQKIKLY